MPMFVYASDVSYLLKFREVRARYLFSCRSRFLSVLSGFVPGYRMASLDSIVLVHSILRELLQHCFSAHL